MWSDDDAGGKFRRSLKWLKFKPNVRSIGPEVVKTFQRPVCGPADCRPGRLQVRTDWIWVWSLTAPLCAAECDQQVQPSGRWEGKVIIIFFFHIGNNSSVLMTFDLLLIQWIHQETGYNKLNPLKMIHTNYWLTLECFSLLCQKRKRKRERVSWWPKLKSNVQLFSVSHSLHLCGRPDKEETQLWTWFKGSGAHKHVPHVWCLIS